MTSGIGPSKVDETDAPNQRINFGPVYGASDRIAAYGIDNPVDPVDLHAKIYCMGLNPHQVMTDQLQRPQPLSTRRVIST